MKYKYFSYCPEDGFDTHETLDSALDDANERITNYLDEGWSEDVTSVCVGKITHRAQMCDQVFREGNVDEDGLDESGDWWDPDWEYKCSYKVMRVEQNPAPEVAKLVEALEGLLAITDESLGVSGYHLNGDIARWCELEDVAMAKEALALYRHPQQTQGTSRNKSFAFRADGEANFYTVSERGGNWTARIQFNGEFMCDEQERMTAVITDALAAYRQQGGK